MGLLDSMLGLKLEERIAYDPGRGILFLNFEGMHVRTRDDVDRLQHAVERRCQEIGRPVAAVVNYDAFRLDDAIAGVYAEMVRFMEARYYTRVSRYTTSAFLRLKLGQVFNRGVAPHMFETREEAQAFLDDASK